MTSFPTWISRRDFLKVTAFGAAGFGVEISFVAAESVPQVVRLNPFVRVNSDDTVIVTIKHLEMGQGVATGLTMIVAEQMDADWAQMRWVPAPADAIVFFNTQWGRVQGTGGSSSIANSWEQLQILGASARQLLVEAAATRWRVPAEEISVRKGIVSHPSGRSARFGELAEAAGNLPPPNLPLQKLPEMFTLIGTRVHRMDSFEKTNGSAVFTSDIRRPGMLFATVAHPPRLGAKIKRWDASAARSVRGLREVFEIETGIAVVAEDSWSAVKARGALVIEWDESVAESLDSTDLIRHFRQLAAKEGRIARTDGDPESSFESAARIVESDYEFPYLAHGALEPLNAVCELAEDHCEIWTASQAQTTDQENVAVTLGLQPHQIIIHTQLAGGSFGRRAVPDSDYLVEAVRIAARLKKQTPVMLQWTREDEMRAGRFRPMSFHKLRAALDAKGNIIGWHHRIVAQTILKGLPIEAATRNGVDDTVVGGATSLPYAIPNVKIDLHTPDVAVPVLWWRSVGHSVNAFAVETFVDEIAMSVNKDPVALRRELLRGDERYGRLLDLLTEKAGPRPTGLHRGVAVHQSFGTYVALSADIKLSNAEDFEVVRVCCAVDCGIAVFPDAVRAQMEGGIGMGLSAARFEAITLKNGQVQEVNFDRYRLLRFDSMPRIDVHILAGPGSPTGVGESGLPPLAPAVANALRAAGRSVKKLPMG